MADKTQTPHKKSAKDIVSIFDDRRKKPAIAISTEIERRDLNFIKTEQWYLRVQTSEENQEAS